MDRVKKEERLADVKREPSINFYFYEENFLQIQRAFGDKVEITGLRYEKQEEAENFIVYYLSSLPDLEDYNIEIREEIFCNIKERLQNLGEIINMGEEHESIVIRITKNKQSAGKGIYLREERLVEPKEETIVPKPTNIKGWVCKSSGNITVYEPIKRQ